MSRKRAVYIGAPVAVPDSCAGTAVSRFHATGENHGNLLIGHSLAQQLDVDVTVGAPKADLDELRETHDLVVIPAANFLHADSDWGYWARYVEKLDLPCVMVGLGAQAPGFDDEIRISAGTLRFVRAVSARSAAIGVRGAKTAEILEKLGVRNVQVTGCPSLHQIPGPEGPWRAPTPEDSRSIWLNGSRNVIDHSVNPERMREFEGAVYLQAIERDIDYVLQSELEELTLAAGEAPEDAAHAEIRRSLPALNSVRRHRLRSFIARRCKAFHDVASWLEAGREKTLAIGTRFHGNVAAMITGCPALFIAHDSRTLELCQFAGVPYVRIDQVEDASIDAMAANIDLNGFFSGREERLRNYIGFLNLNGVPHKLGSASPELAN